MGISMVSRGEDKYVIWPIYFDKTVSREEGRKVPLQKAVEKPNIDDILKVAKKLNLHPILEKNASYPERYWRKEGRILVDKIDSKVKILRMIANQL